MTIKQLLQIGALRLQNHTIEAPMRESQILLCRVLGYSKEQLYLYQDQAILIHFEQKFYSFLGRREKGEPIAYILGEKDFFGFPVIVNKSVLIPRPETEILVEEVLRIAKRISLSDTLFLDVGTGSGAISLAIANTISHVSILALDISRKALDVVEENKKRMGLIMPCCIESDLLSSVSYPKEKVVIIMANLPYIPTEEISVLSTDVMRYEPHLALDGGKKRL